MFILIDIKRAANRIINHFKSNQQVALQVQHALDFYPKCQSIIYKLKDAACLKSALIMLGEMCAFNRITALITPCLAVVSF